MTFKDFIGSGNTGIIGVINNILVPVLATLAFAVFLWGLFKFFILHGDSEDEREKGKQFALWGVLGLVVFFSLWGLVNILLVTLGIHP